MDWQGLEVIIGAAALLITVITIVVKQGSRISVIENELERLDRDFKLHESLNETTFARLEQELKGINANLNKLLGYFEATKDK
jgi:hypothetical protein